MLSERVPKAHSVPLGFHRRFHLAFHFALKGKQQLAQLTRDCNSMCFPHAWNNSVVDESVRLELFKGR